VPWHDRHGGRVEPQASLNELPADVQAKLLQLTRERVTVLERVQGNNVGLAASDDAG
jgi:hypothetical protein